MHNRDLDPVTKLLYLQECCIGKAEVSLGSCKPLAENYVQAWESLKQIYSDDYQIKQSIIDNIFKIERLEHESHDGLRAILDIINSNLRQLKVIMEVPIEEWGDIMIKHWTHESRKELN